MASDPRARFQSADALRRALRRYQQMRRAVPALAAMAILAAIAVPAGTLWLRQHQPEKAVVAIAPPKNAGSIPELPQAPHAELRVNRFEIPHFPKLDQQHYDAKRSGLMGRTSFAAREDDDVTVQAELSEPAYSYLIAFRPDGTDELCDPDDENARPAKKRQPVYPAPAKSDDRYRLSEGAGLYAFAVVVSRDPLPPYREWKKRVGPMSWAAKLPCDPGVVWRDDADGLVPLLADDGAGTRGKGAKARDSGGPAAKLANWLRGLSGVDLVALEAFPVERASAP
jgi:hypothetical protein